MKITVLILGLILGAILLIQSVLVAGLAGATDDTGSTAAGIGGLMMAFLWLVAVALVFSVPLVSMALFGLAGLLGFAFAAEYSSLEVWAVVSLILGAFSFFAWRGKRREDIRKRLDREQIASLLSGRASQGGVAAPVPAPDARTVICPQCGTGSALSVRFFPNCGLPRPLAQASS